MRTFDVPGKANGGTVTLSVTLSVEKSTVTVDAQRNAGRFFVQDFEFDRPENAVKFAGSFSDVSAKSLLMRIKP